MNRCLGPCWASRLTFSLHPSPPSSSRPPQLTLRRRRTQHQRQGLARSLSRGLSILLWLQELSAFPSRRPAFHSPLEPAFYPWSRIAQRVPLHFRTTSWCRARFVIVNLSCMPTVFNCGLTKTAPIVQSSIHYSTPLQARYSLYSSPSSLQIPPDATDSS